MKTKITLYIVVLLFAALLVYFITDSYAVFETQSNGTANLSIGSWVIRLNSIDISSGETVSFSINSFNYGASNHVSSGVIAPGRSGYFDLIIDPDGTDVSVRYDITLDMEENYGDNITYYVITSDGTTIRTDENTYSGVIDMASIDNGDVATLRIVVEWTNNALYDQSDTNLGLTNNANISIPAQITVMQYLGETITEYIEE